MTVLIQSATVLDTSSTHHKKVVDILIEKGKITTISNKIEPKKGWTVVSEKNLHVSQGWFDSSVSFGEPGYEEREDLENGLYTAAKSGFTSVAINPNTHPVIDSYADVAYVINKAQKSPVNAVVIGSLTKDGNGTDLAEMFDMHNAGAVAYYDYKKSINNPNVIKLALQYASNFGGIIMSFPNNEAIAGHGVMNEETTSTLLGLKGIPSLAEEIRLVRDLYLVEYTGGTMHIPTISTAKSVDLIRAAKSKGLNISCSVAVHNLVLTDEILKNFDSNYKVLPPLRTETDRLALIEGVKDGTIDMVTSDHNPLDIELKKLEFDRADFGTIGLESFFGALQTVFSTAKSIEILTSGKHLFKVQGTSIEEGEVADLSLFNPAESYVFGEENIFSKSHNSIFKGKKLKGKVYGTFSKNQLTIN
ncbi:dihydroorotase [Aegicerativicinus sediminis]